MKKIIFMGRSGSGKTTLTQAMLNTPISYNKTQAIDYYSGIIDTPGEYAETKRLGSALALYSYEADIVGLLLSATEPYSLYPPNITCMANREIIGIVTHIDCEDANVKQAENWLKLTGCEKIFYVNSKNSDTLLPLLEYLQA